MSQSLMSELIFQSLKFKQYNNLPFLLNQVKGLCVSPLRWIDWHIFWIEVNIKTAVKTFS